MADYNQSVKYRIYIEQDEDGVFVVTCPALPGGVSQGRTRQEARDQIRDAIELYVQSLREHGDAVPSKAVSNQRSAFSYLEPELEEVGGLKPFAS